MQYVSKLVRHTQYPFYNRLDGPKGRCLGVRETSSPPGFDPRMVQPIPKRRQTFDKYKSIVNTIHEIVCENTYRCDAARRLVPPGGLGYWVAGVLHDAGDAPRRGPDPPDPGTASPAANMRVRKLHPDAHSAPTCGQLPRCGSLCCGAKFHSLRCFGTRILSVCL